MKILKIVLLGLLIISVNAQGAKWQKLKPLNAYKGNAYHLKENVAYMEIRWYATKKGKKITETLKLYRKPLESYPEDTILKFRSLKPKYSNNADIGWSGNAFFIDTEGKMFQMDMRKDIMSLLGKIDKPAEVELILYLNNAEGKHYFKKTSKGYRVKTVEKLKGCTSKVGQGMVNRSGKYTDEFRYNLQRKGCKKRKHTKFIHNKKVNYQSYDKIVLDDKGNIYVLGSVIKSKLSDEYNSFYVLEKYTNNGKRVWSKKLKGYPTSLVVKNSLVYVFNDKKLKVTYRLNGKKSSFGKVVAVSQKEKNIYEKKYSPEGLPNKKEATDFYLSDYAKDNKGNIYIVGSEVFYPSGSPDDVPSGECGNVEEVHGALIAKLNSKGKTVWAKVIDRND
ncbi:hypothetical protein [Sulfurovum sp. NBC37-1]|uniref:hypothetical protein n=1 Tax=Sulfurovum sp. (strain NBC37-1) TaxID=387093 RepID=UPI0001587A08|nr:hypothetical protein [Sulfurovum sp. NBC37-1]BAF72973.1 hypothetical protein SUN_2031 [Sulfurovum sp. NBC37-1]